MPIKNKILCFESSLNANEEMYGTATTADIWVMVEYRGHWSGSAFKDSKIPKNVKSHLSKEVKSMSGSRLQLIKKHDNKNPAHKMFIADSTEPRPRLYEINFNTYEDLLSLKLKKILKSEKYLTERKLYIVCTNGEYDTCCGKFGMPIYMDLSKGTYGAETWESNHIGGHRFASTFVCLPHGLVYGRVREGKTAEKLISQYESGTVDITNYRGRSCYSEDVQAAEYYVRKETGIQEISGLSLKSLKNSGKKSNVKFLSDSGAITHKVKLTQDKNAVKIIKSCGEKSSYIPQYRLLDYQKK